MRCIWASLIFNSDLVETLELDNLVGQAVVAMLAAANRGESRVPMPARIIPLATIGTGWNTRSPGVTQRPGCASTMVRCTPTH